MKITFLLKTKTWVKDNVIHKTVLEANSSFTTCDFYDGKIGAISGVWYS